jgi:hypothetical protein
MNMNSKPGFAKVARVNLCDVQLSTRDFIDSALPDST